MKLVESSLAKGHRENGYRVISQADPGYKESAQIEVDIEKFWGWFQPGFWTVKLHFETLIRLKGLFGPFIDGEEFDSNVERSCMAATEENWLLTIHASLDELNNDIVEDLSAYRDVIKTVP